MSDTDHLDATDVAEVSDSRRLRWPTPPETALALVVVAYVGYFTYRSLTIHHAFGSASYDVGLYDQGVWLMSRFKTPFVTLMGRNLFGDHASFILVGLVPFYWLFPATGVLFVAQSIAIGAAAIPIYLCGRARLGNEWWAVIAAGAYLLHPAVGWTNLENYHPDSFVAVFVAFAIYGALERRWRLYAVFVVLALLVKEDVSLVVVPLGAWVALKRDRRIGLLTIAGSLAFMAFAMFVVMRGLNGVATRNSWRIPFGGPGGLIRTTFTHPTRLLDYLGSDGRPWYLWQMTAPFAWLFARAPSVASISALVLFTNILSTFWYQYQVEYHYALVAVPALAIGTVYAIGEMADRERERRYQWVAMVALWGAALVTSFLWSPMPWSRNPGWIPPATSEWADQGREMIELVPPDAVVSAQYRVTAQMAHRVEIYQFPVPFRQVLYGAGGNDDGPRLPERAERVQYVLLPIGDDYPVGDWELIEPAFDLVAENDYWRLWRRDPDRPLPGG